MVDAPRVVYRFVHVEAIDDPRLREQFLSDRENGMTPFFRREKRYPEILDGMSAYRSLDEAAVRWEQCRAIAERRNEPIQVGNFIAEVELSPDQGFAVEDLEEEDGHLTIWGDPDRLAGATRRITTPQDLEE